MKISALMVILVLHVQYSQAQNSSECAYTYQEQPPTHLECNPYPNNRLILSCVVRGPNLVSIDWFWEPLNTRQPQRLPSTQNKYSLVTQFSASQSRSQLRVQQLNDNDAGWYYCQGNLSNGTLLIPSNRLFLAVQSEYTGALNATTCPVETQSTREPTCASIASTTATPNLITDGERGSTDSTTSLPTFLLTTTITLTPTPTMTTVPNSESSRLWVALYSMAAMIVVFCAIIATLGFTTVIVYKRKSGDTTPKKTADQELGANPFSTDATRLCACTCRKSGGAESSGDIPLEECVAYGTHEKRRGRGDFTVATSECPAYGVVEREERMARDEAYENLKHNTHSHNEYPYGSKLPMQCQNGGLQGGAFC